MTAEGILRGHSWPWYWTGGTWETKHTHIFEKKVLKRLVRSNLESGKAEIEARKRSAVSQEKEWGTFRLWMSGGEQRATDGALRRWQMLLQALEQTAALWRSVCFTVSCSRVGKTEGILRRWKPVNSYKLYLYAMPCLLLEAKGLVPRST